MDDVQFDAEYDTSSEIWWTVSGLAGLVFLVSITLLVLDMPINLMSVCLGLIVFIFGSLLFGMVVGLPVIGFLMLMSEENERNNHQNS